MFTFRRMQVNVIILYNENIEKRNLTYWRLIYQNIEKLFNKNFKHIKDGLNKD